MHVHTDRHTSVCTAKEQPQSALGLQVTCLIHLSVNWNPGFWVDELEEVVFCTTVHS